MIKMDKLTYKQAEKYHREMWRDLARTGFHAKEGWSGWNDFDRYASLSFFPCEIGICQNGGPKGCACPVIWPGGAGCFTTTGGSDEIYAQWYDAADPETRKVLAAQIAALPWRLEEDYETN